MRATRKELFELLRLSQYIVFEHHTSHEVIPGMLCTICQKPKVEEMRKRIDMVLANDHKYGYNYRGVNGE